MAPSRSNSVPARPLTRSARAAWLGERATSQVSPPEHSPWLTAAWTTGREMTRSPKPNDTGAINRRFDRPHAVAYSVVSAMPNWLNASRRSAHLLQRPQCRSERGAMQEKVRSRAKRSAGFDDLVLLATGEGSHHLEGASECPTGQRREAGEEGAVGVGKRIGGQRAECDGGDAIERTPHARLGQQQEVAAGQVDGVVG